MNDPFGEAIRDFYENGKAPAITVNSNYTEGEEILPSWFFRTESEMPEIEQTALNLCRGKVLDVGAAAGCHSMILQHRGLDVTAIEKSTLASQIMKKRGLQKVVTGDIYGYADAGFDTILLLMNGCGIGETVAGLEKLLVHLKELLARDGRIFMDSSDISYLFHEDDGSLWIDLANNNYYGEMEYEVMYKKSKQVFKWLFIDFEKLKKTAEKAGLDCKLIVRGKHYDYLAQLAAKR